MESGRPLVVYTRPATTTTAATGRSLSLIASCPFPSPPLLLYLSEGPAGGIWPRPLQQVCNFCFSLLSSADCTFNGKKLTEGQSASDPEDPCVRCQCTAGGLVCAKKSCPVLACPASKSVLKPGACCPECQGSHGDFEPKGRCLVGKKFYQNGSSFRPDSCTNCTCRDTTSICHRQVCPPVKLCPPGVQEDGDVCCPKCRPVAMKTAPAINALPTQISPTLPASRPSTCSYRGVTYQDGGTWSLDSCTQCMCNKGEVRCSVQQCPVYRTRNEIHSHHGQSKASKGTKSKKNKMWRSTPPTFTNAQASPCPAGHHPVKEPGQCCPKCVEGKPSTIQSKSNSTSQNKINKIQNSKLIKFKIMSFN